MSFVGLVTRKEEDTGVTLLAKIVTPNKKKSAKKAFKVKVKANALDDYSCCVIDHATAKERIENSQDMMNLVGDISLPYNGVNGTTISYKIINQTSATTFPLSDYLAEDGKILGRPKFDPNTSGDASGYLEITVSKGNASVQSRIVVSVKGISAEEVLSREDMYNDAVLWARIRGNNESTFIKGNEWSGYNNIHSTLFLIKELDASDMSNANIDVTWSVADDILAYVSGNEEFGKEPRIDVNTGSIVRPSYTAACTLIGQIPDVKYIGDSANSTSVQNRRVRIGGITLTATLTLGGASKIIEFKCATLSKYITNKEIMDVVIKNMGIILPTNQTIPYKDQYDGQFFTIAAPASGGTYKLKALGNTASMELFEDRTLYLELGSISGVAFSHSIKSADGLQAYDPISHNLVFGSGFITDEQVGEAYYVLNIDFAAMNTQSIDKRSFAIVTNVQVSGYSRDGINPGGQSELLDRYLQVKVETSAMNVVPES